MQREQTESATVIAVAGLTQETLKIMLGSIASVSRKIAIGIINETPYEWEALNKYFDSGTSESVLPEFVKKGKVALYTARKTRGPVATGSVGVFTYYMTDAHKTIAVMFHIPFDYNLYSNYWDVKIYAGKERATLDMYKSMYYNHPFEGDNGWHIKDVDGFQVKGTMTNGGKCLLQLRISK